MLNAYQIRTEFQRLDKLLGINTESISIAIRNLPDETWVGCCHIDKQTGMPDQIIINFALMKDRPDEDWYDTIRHEYAHAAVNMIYGPNNGEGPHGPTWCRMCERISCRQETHVYDMNVQEVLRSIPAYGTPKVGIMCRRCKNVVTQPQNSRMARVLKAGYASFNVVCGQCGGATFKLIPYTGADDNGKEAN